jgi:hypothetical protein
MAPLVRHTQAWWQQMRDHYYRNYGPRSRSAAQNLYPTHPSSSMHYLSKAANPRPQSGTAARLYAHLPSGAAARMSKPKPKPRVSRARRIYGDEF